MELRMEKAQAKLEKLIAKLTRLELRLNGATHRFDIEDLQRGIGNTKEEIENAKRNIEKMAAKMASAEADAKVLREMPKAIKEFRAYVAKTWINYDIKERNEIAAFYKSNGYKETIKEYGYGFKDKMGKSDEQIEVKVNKDADQLVLNLNNRLSGITGKITDAKSLTISHDNKGHVILNGLVVGESGKAEVESIMAGGYNIQKLHVRVLVKKVK